MNQQQLCIQVGVLQRCFTKACFPDFQQFPDFHRLLPAMLPLPTVALLPSMRHRL
jgi:hypothetical protein